MIHACEVLADVCELLDHSDASAGIETHCCDEVAMCVARILPQLAHKGNQVAIHVRSAAVPHVGRRPAASRPRRPAARRLSF